MPKDKSIYNDKSIESLDARSHIKLRPGMYAGDTSTPNQLLLEAFSNALDEFNIGHGKDINVSILDSGVCVVEDEAQGFPICKVRPEDGKTILEASYSVINTSAKYSDDGVYSGSSLGLNGVGLKLVTFLSEYLEVESHKDGKFERIRFEDGLFVKRDSGKWDGKTKSGTRVEFKPDKRYFTTDKTDSKYFSKFFNDMCCLCDGLTINLTTDGGTESISKNGINDFISSRINNNIEIINNRFLYEKNDVKLGMTFTSNSSSDIIAYVNYGITESGPHITTMKSIITRVLNSWAREKDLLKKKEKNLDGASVQEGMLLVCNIVSKGVAYNAQTKEKIVKIDTSCLDEFAKQLEIWLDNNPEDGKNIIEKALLARRAAEAAKKAREAVKNKSKKKDKVKILHPDKLKDAEFLGEDSTLLIVEGLSAGASMCVARDPERYGILMLRGKLINALNKNDAALLKNEEIQLLFKALGIEPHTYDPSKLRYGSVAICVDSDSDGGHISLLIMSALYHFCPQFIEDGRLKWLRSPLYIVKDKSSKTEQYYFNDQEMNAAKAKGIVKGEVQRNKGLGSLSMTQAKASMFGDNQYMDVITSTDDGILLLKSLMGKDASDRKQYVFNNIDFTEVRE